MISAVIGSLDERPAFDPYIRAVERVGSGHHQRTRRREGQADDARSGTNNSASRSVLMRTTPCGPPAGGHVQAAFFVECHALRTSQSAIVDFHFAFMRNAIHAIETGSSGAGHIEIPVRAVGKMIGGDRRLQRGEDEDLAAGADFEDGSLAVADVQAAIRIEAPGRWPRPCLPRTCWHCRWASPGRRRHRGGSKHTAGPDGRKPGRWRSSFL